MKQKKPQNTPAKLVTTQPITKKITLVIYLHLNIKMKQI